MRYQLSDADRRWIGDTIALIEEKMEWVSQKSKNKIPYTTIEGVHDDRSDPTGGWGEDSGLSWWCNGFFGGMMWQLNSLTGKEHYARIARSMEKKLDQCFEDYYGLHHDVGFMWLPTAVADYKITGDPEARKRFLLDKRPDLGALWLYHQLYPYRKAGISGHR